MSIIARFPLPVMRTKQGLVLEAIERQFESGVNTILLESPVGAGKSAIAMTAAEHYGSSHILTTQKALQDQYFSDFKGKIVTMKGRNSYPCTHTKFSNGVPHVGKYVDILEGNCNHNGYGSCAEGPCTIAFTMDAYAREVANCNKVDDRGCPYVVAAGVAASSQHVIHNIHSFYYQTNFASKFEQRDLMIVDECHDLDSTIREVCERTFTFYEDVSHISFDKMTVHELYSFFTVYLLRFATKVGEEYFPINGQEENVEKIQSLLGALQHNFRDDNFVAHMVTSKRGHSVLVLRVLDVGETVNKGVLEYGSKRLLMSGTIFNKEFYCDLNGLDPQEVSFIRSTSDFPVPNRPVIYSHSLGVNCQRATWYKNDGLGKIIRSLKVFLDRHPNEKGVIHVGSYEEAGVLKEALRSLNRVMSHTPDDYNEALNAFYRSEIPNLVFISPRSQQGVDMIGDRARFQIITKVPYLNVGDKVIQKLKERNKLWYQLKTLTVFGQQLGRIVRSPTDYGVTYLLDARFPNFLRGMWQYIPEWQREAIRFIK